MATTPLGLPTHPRIRSVSFGTLRKDVVLMPVRCQSPTAYVTRIDMQTNESRSFGRPFVSGLRFTCSDHLAVPSVNWSARQGQTTDRFNTITTYFGGDMSQGVRNVLVSHGTYVNLIGYGDATLVGNAELQAGDTVWQQAATTDPDDMRACVLVGMDVAYVAWMDGCTMHFACPSPSSMSPSGTPSTRVDPSAAPEGHVAPSHLRWLAAGASAGLGVALFVWAAVVLVKLRRRQTATGDMQSTKYAAIEGGAVVSEMIAPAAVQPFCSTNACGSCACRGGRSSSCLQPAFLRDQVNQALVDPWTTPVGIGEVTKVSGGVKADDAHDEAVGLTMLFPKHS